MTYVASAQQEQDLEFYLRRNENIFARNARDAVEASANRVAEIKQATAASLDDIESKLEAQKKAAQAQLRTRTQLVAATVTDPKTISRHFQAKLVQLPLIEQELVLIALRRRDLKVQVDRREDLVRQVAIYNRVATKHRSLTTENERQRTEVRRRLNRLRCAAPLICRADQRKLNDLVQMARGLRGDGEKLQRRKIVLQASLVARAMPGTASAAVSNVDAIAEVYRKEVAHVARQAADASPNNVRAAFLTYGAQALWVTLLVFLTPILHKLFALLVLAPLAARARPLRLGEAGSPMRASPASHHTLSVALDPGDELLIRGTALDSSSAMQGRDRAVLDWGMPLASVAAGLTNLQRLRGDRPDHVRLAATQEHGELRLLDLPAGTAVTLRPRALVAVRRRRDRRLRIERPWRLGHLTAWLRGQWRYIVFHGPCALVVQGRRGVAVAYAGDGRKVDRRLTLGFETTVALGSRRTDSFRPYWQGEAALVQDHFTGDGCYLYENSPSAGARGGILGRGLKGLGGAALNVLGI